MKKRLIASALAVALGTTARSVSLSDAVYGFTDISNISGSAVGSLSSTVTVSTNDDTGAITLTAPSGSYFSSGTAIPNSNNKRTNYTISLVLDLSGMGTPESAAEFLFYNPNGVGLGLDTNRRPTGTWLTSNASYLATTSTLGYEGKVIVTLVTGVIDTEDNTHGARVYAPQANGSLGFFSNTRLMGTGNASEFNINTTYAGAIDRVYIFDSALQRDEVNTVTAEIKAALVPEPTTATLSLLALVGLCARRRRK